MSQQTVIHRVKVILSSVLPPVSSIVAAVSGGADSTALLFLLYELRERLAIKKIVVAHLNYGLRGDESDSDEMLVCRHAERLQVPFFSKNLYGHVLTEPGMENWARKERYAFLSTIRQQTGCTVIATGHTLDDQAETVVMRMMRGTGLNGLRGIAVKREDGVIRPLLTIKKQELVGWLAHRKIAFRDDASNHDCHFLRNRIRHQILPLLEQCHPGAVDHFAAYAFDAQKQWTLQQNRIDEWIRENFHHHTAESFRILKSGIAENLSAAEALRRIGMKYAVTLDRIHIDAVIAATTCSGYTLLLPGGWYCATGQKYLYFEKTKPVFVRTLPIPGKCRMQEENLKVRITVVPSVPEQLDCGKSTVFIDGDTVGESCIYRSITPEDAFVPFGLTRRVNVFQFLSKQGLQKPDREHCGILTTHDNRPIWIPGIRLDERFRVTSHTKIVIKVQSSSFF